MAKGDTIDKTQFDAIYAMLEQIRYKAQSCVGDMEGIDRLANAIQCVMTGMDVRDIPQAHVNCTCDYSSSRERVER